ncbi:FAD/FMN-containing dehydrogenase [Pseudomonas sp.]|uniref:FAD/FMN-containing dehydrogenase n=1 Tax=Pseudomonas sp. TaxID=306 RepID=UPI00272BFAD2|nr:FAD/FMN-containing dehydrogenase [Pseudomonas sp.]
MKPMKPIVTLLLSLSVMAFSHAEERVDRVEPWTLNDQFDQPYRFDASERVLLIAASNGAAKLVDDAIKNKPQGWLAERQVTYVADITHVPRLVANRVLVPSMRSASYRILLDREGEVASRYVEDRKPVLWLTLDNGRIAERQRFDSSDALRLSLESLELDASRAHPQTATD